MILKIKNQFNSDIVYFNAELKDSSESEITFKLKKPQNYFSSDNEETLTNCVKEFNNKYGLFDKKHAIITIIGTSFPKVRLLKYYLYFLMFGIRKTNITFYSDNTSYTHAFYNSAYKPEGVSLDMTDDEILKLAATIRIQKQFRKMKHIGSYKDTEDEYEYILDI